MKWFSEWGLESAFLRWDDGGPVLWKWRIQNETSLIGAESIKEDKTQLSNVQEEERSYVDTQEVE